MFSLVRANFVPSSEPAAFEYVFVLFVGDHMAAKCVCEVARNALGKITSARLGLNVPQSIRCRFSTQVRGNGKIQIQFIINKTGRCSEHCNIAWQQTAIRVRVRVLRTAKVIHNLVSWFAAHICTGPPHHCMDSVRAFIAIDCVYAPCSGFSYHRQDFSISRNRSRRAEHSFACFGWTPEHSERNFDSVKNFFQRRLAMRPQAVSSTILFFWKRKTCTASNCRTPSSYCV